MELMVTLVVAAVILGMGVPSFREYQRNNRLTVSANDMLSLAIASRNEAIRRQSTVSLCPSAAPTSTTATSDPPQLATYSDFPSFDNFATIG